MRAQQNILTITTQRLSCLLLFLMLTIHCAHASAQGLPSELQSAWQKTGLPDSALSVMVQEIDGPELISINAQTPRNPASVMKLVTTWAALQGLGPEHRWRTELYAQKFTVDEQGTLKGPLYIKAAGDPVFSIADLWSLLRDLRLRGVKNLTEVVVDRSIFGQVGIDTYAFDGAGDRPYNASSDAMVVGLGAARIVMQPDTQRKKWVAFVDPPLPGVRLDNQIEWSNQRCPGAPAVQTEVKRQAQSGVTIQLKGQAAGSCGEFSIYRLAMDQPQFFESVFRMLWRELGGTLAKGFSSGTVPRNADLIVWHDSIPLADVIRLVNKQSNNLMANHLLLSLGTLATENGAQNNHGASVATRLLNEQGVNTSGWEIDNGSGLSRIAAVTAQGLAQMLQQAWYSPLMPEFMSSLAIAGVDGTVRRRLNEDEVRGRAHLKTGTLRDARALAGYVLAANGKRYVLVSVANHAQAAAIRPFNDALVKWVAER